MATRNIRAANQHDNEIDLKETTYRVELDNSAEVTIHQRWRAFTAQGRTAISKIQIPYVAAFQDVEFKFIKTLKKDGTVVTGDTAGAFDAAPSADPLAPFFTDLKLKTLFPANLETGDSVEFGAVMHVRKFPKPGDFWFVHDLTTTVPVVSETVVLDLPVGRKVVLYESSTVPGKTETINGRRIERWTASNPEPAKGAVGGVAPLFAVSSVPSWDALGEWLHSLNQNAASPTPEIAVLAAKLTANKFSEQERIAALYTYVATKVRYVGIAFAMGRLQPHDASVVLHNAYGDCKDQTALLSALLEAAEFKAHAVLTTPGIGVRARDVPSPEFNHEFVAVETKSGLVFLDTSMGPVQPQVLPPGTRGRSALLVGATTSSIVDIPLQSPVPSRIGTSLKGTLTGAGAFEGSARFEFQGVAELALRRVFLDGAEVDKEKALRQLAGAELRNATIRQISGGDAGDLTKPFRVDCELSERDFFPQTKPSLRVGVELPSEWAAFLALKPDRPVPMEAFLGTSNMDLVVDSSFTITNGMPVHRKAPFGSFDSEFSYRSGHLMLARSLELKATTIEPSEWATSSISYSPH